MFDLMLDTEDNGTMEISVTSSQLKMLIQTNEWHFVNMPADNPYWEIVNADGIPVGTCDKGG